MILKIKKFLKNFFRPEPKVVKIKPHTNTNQYFSIGDGGWGFYQYSWFRGRIIYNPILYYVSIQTVPIPSTYIYDYNTLCNEMKILNITSVDTEKTRSGSRYSYITQFYPYSKHIDINKSQFKITHKDMYVQKN